MFGAEGVVAFASLSRVRLRFPLIVIAESRRA
jgi:hypothetical protein